MKQVIQLDPWQKEVLATKGNIALRSGRQTGKSTVVSILAGREAITKPNQTIMVIASVERQAYLLFEKILNYLETNYSKFILRGKNRPTKTRLKLKNGSILYCLPTGLSGSGIRGFTIDTLIADESAFIPEEVFTAVTPALASRKGSRIILLSTPHGRKGYFARAFRENSGFKTFHISSEECPRIDKEFLKSEQERMSKLQYTQEYLGEFIDDLQQWFPDELIIKCMTGKRRNTIIKNREYSLGVDLARMGKDQSTFEIFEMTKERKLIQIENITTSRTYLSHSTRMIVDLDTIYNFQKIFIDDEGIGVGVFDHLMEIDSIKRKLVAINNSKRVYDYKNESKTKILKEDLYNNLLRLMETGDIILLDDPEIFQSLKSVQYEYTSDMKGRPHLRIYGNFTHIVEGIIRSSWILKNKNLNIWIRSFKI